MFTVNFPKDDDHSPFVLTEADLPEWITFCCWQEELGENLTHHLQGYLECMGMASVKKLLSVPIFGDAQKEGFSVHFEPRRGTQAQALAYVRKKDATTISGTYTELGVLKDQGKKKKK